MHAQKVNRFPYAGGMVRKRQAQARGKEVVRLLNEGWTHEEIAEKLAVTARTVKSHVRIHAKQYGVFGSKQLIAEARRCGDMHVPTNERRKALLSERQKHVLRLVSRDWTTQRIADHLGCSYGAVSAVLSVAAKRLGTAGRYATLDKAIELGELSKKLKRTMIPNPLTERECQMLQLRASGYSLTEIAEEMGYASRRTTLKLLRDIRTKLCAVDFDDAIEIAQRYRMIDKAGKRIAKVSRDIWAKLYSYRHKPHFTPRELEVLYELGKTRDTDTLAQRLGIATDTVEAYCITVARKLGTADRLSSAVKAKELGLVSSAQFERTERLELSKRELEILEGLEDGQSYKQIAKRFALRHRTVHVWVKNAMLALRAHSIKEMLERYREIRKRQRPEIRLRSTALDRQMRPRKAVFRPR